jgi:hypothetical protein
MADISARKLRRLAGRAIRVQQRRAKESPVIAAYDTTLPPKAQAFIKAYDAAAKYKSDWLREMAEGRGAVAQLVKQVRAWLPFLVRDIGGFDGTGVMDQPQVPDDVITDAALVLDVVDDATGSDGKPLPYKDALINAVTAALTVAQKEWGEAEAADSTYQQLLKDVRAGGAAFDTELVAFRRSLGHVTGRSDKDYQKLRAARAAHADDEDDTGAPPASMPVPPASPDDKPPTDS